MTIAYYIASPTWGGGEQYVYNLARTVKKDYGITPIFLFPNHSDPTMVSRFEEIGACPSFRYSGKIWRFSPWAGKRLARVLDQYEVDILHLNSRQSYFLGAWAKRATKKPLRLIVSQHLVRQAKNTSLWHWAYKQIDTLICVSQKVKQTYLSVWTDSACPFKKVHVVSNSVPVSSVEHEYTTNHSPVIFFHGRICQEKGVLEVVQALEQIQDIPFRFILAGTIAPSFASTWEAYLKQSPIRERIQYLGFRTDVVNLIPQYQIGVIPSIVPEAGGPLAFLENMALGLPTISSDNGSQPEFIRDGKTGILCSPRDIDAWSKAIRRLLTNPNKAATMAKEAQQDFFRKFSYEQFISKMMQIYQTK